MAHKNNKTKKDDNVVANMTLRIDYPNGSYQMIKVGNTFDGSWAQLANSVASGYYPLGEKVKWSVI